MFRNIMGNEESRNSMIDFDDDDAVEVTESWTLRCARNVNGSKRVSAFVSHQGMSGRSSDSLRKLAKNLMIHRHPSIVQFISSWKKNDAFHLITEEVRPLTHVLGDQSALQICIGLHSLLKALTFLHEKARSSHNNLCCGAVYVTPEGVWKLGGLDYLMKFSDVTPRFLQESRARRYEKAVPPEEDALLPTAMVNAEAIDQYAFGVLVDEVLEKKPTDEFPYLSDFKALCKKELRSSDPSQRSKLSEIMSHPFFNHDFIKIHNFLSELPLKLSREKEDFFRDLTVQLTSLPEEIVASQLASLLLSRIVILDEAAQKHILPMVFRPKTSEAPESTALFSEETFKHHVVPKLLQMFCVRDAQVRLILLTHLGLYCGMFTTEQLKHQVLPEMLIGVKDVNDQLVSTTLKALADLVPILGSATVIGGKRAKLFTDGVPKALDLSCGAARVKPGRDGGSPIKSRCPDSMYASGELPERPSPDGGEDELSNARTVEDVEMDAENWSDWESPGEGKEEEEAETQGSSRQPLPDIATLDIKCTLPKEEEEETEKEKEKEKESSEIDFFRDMEPVISSTPQSVMVIFAKNKFDVCSDAEDVGGDWDEGWGLGEENES